MDRHNLQNSDELLASCKALLSQNCITLSCSSSSLPDLSNRTTCSQLSLESTELCPRLDYCLSSSSSFILSEDCDDNNSLHLSTSSSDFYSLISENDRYHGSKNNHIIKPSTLDDSFSSYESFIDEEISHFKNSLQKEYTTHENNLKPMSKSNSEIMMLNDICKDITQILAEDSIYLQTPQNFANAENRNGEGSSVLIRPIVQECLGGASHPSQTTSSSKGMLASQTIVQPWQSCYPAWYSKAEQLLNSTEINPIKTTFHINSSDCTTFTDTDFSICDSEKNVAYVPSVLQEQNVHDLNEYISSKSFKKCRLNRFSFRIKDNDGLRKSKSNFSRVLQSKLKLFNNFFTVMYSVHNISDFNQQYVEPMLYLNSCSKCFSGKMINFILKKKRYHPYGNIKLYRYFNKFSCSEFNKFCKFSMENISRKSDSITYKTDSSVDVQDGIYHASIALITSCSSVSDNDSEQCEIDNLTDFIHSNSCCLLKRESVKAELFNAFSDNLPGTSCDVKCNIAFTSKTASVIRGRCCNFTCEVLKPHIERVTSVGSWQLTLLSTGILPKTFASQFCDSIKGSRGCAAGNSAYADEEVTGCVRVVTKRGDILHFPVIEVYNSTREELSIVAPDCDRWLMNINNLCEMANLQRSASQTCSSSGPRSEHSSRLYAFKLMKNERETVRKLLPYFIEKSKTESNYIPFRCRKLSVDRVESLKRRSDLGDVHMYRETVPRNNFVHDVNRSETCIDDSPQKIRLCGTALGVKPLTSSNNMFNSMQRSSNTRCSSPPTSPLISVSGSTSSSPHRKQPTSRDCSAPPGTLPVTACDESFRYPRTKQSLGTKYIFPTTLNNVVSVESQDHNSEIKNCIESNGSDTTHLSAINLCSKECQINNERFPETSQKQLDFRIDASESISISNQENNNESICYHTENLAQEPSSTYFVPAMFVPDCVNLNEGKENINSKPFSGFISEDLDKVIAAEDIIKCSNAKMFSNISNVGGNYQENELVNVHSEDICNNTCDEPDTLLSNYTTVKPAIVNSLPDVISDRNTEVNKSILEFSQLVQSETLHKQIIETLLSENIPAAKPSFKDLVSDEDIVISYASENIPDTFLPCEIKNFPSVPPVARNTNKPSDSIFLVSHSSPSTTSTVSLEHSQIFETKKLQSHSCELKVNNSLIKTSIAMTNTVSEHKIILNDMHDDIHDTKFKFSSCNSSQLKLSTSVSTLPTSESCITTYSLSQPLSSPTVINDDQFSTLQSNSDCHSVSFTESVLSNLSTDDINSSITYNPTTPVVSPIDTLTDDTVCPIATEISLDIITSTPPDTNDHKANAEVKLATVTDLPSNSESAISLATAPVIFISLPNDVIPNQVKYSTDDHSDIENIRPRVLSNQNAIDLTSYQNIISNPEFLIPSTTHTIVANLSSDFVNYEASNSKQTAPILSNSFSSRSSKSEPNNVSSSNIISINLSTPVETRMSFVADSTPKDSKLVPALLLCEATNGTSFDTESLNNQNEIISVNESNEIEQSNVLTDVSSQLPIVGEINTNIPNINVTTVKIPSTQFSSSFNSTISNDDENMKTERAGRPSRSCKFPTGNNRGLRLTVKATEIARHQGAIVSKPLSITFPADIVRSNSQCLKGEEIFGKTVEKNSSNSSFRSKSTSPMTNDRNHSAKVRRFQSSPPITLYEKQLVENTSLKSINSSCEILKSTSTSNTVDTITTLSPASFVNTVYVDVLPSFPSKLVPIPVQKHVSPENNDPLHLPPVYVSKFTRVSYCDVTCPKKEEISSSPDPQTIRTELNLSTVPFSPNENVNIYNRPWLTNFVDRMIKDIFNFSSKEWISSFSRNKSESEIIHDVNKSLVLLNYETNIQPIYVKKIDQDIIVSNSSDVLYKKSDSIISDTVISYDSSLPFIDESNDQVSTTACVGEESVSSADRNTCHEDASASNSNSSNGSETWWAPGGPVARREKLPLEENDPTPEWAALLCPNLPENYNEKMEFISDDDFDTMDEDMRRLEEKIRQFEHELEEDLEISLRNDEPSYRKMPNFALLDKSKLRSSPLPEYYPPVCLLKTKHLSLMTAKDILEYLDSDSDSESSSCSSSENGIFLKRKIKLKPGDRKCRSLDLQKRTFADECKSEYLIKMLSMSKTNGTRISKGQVKPSPCIPDVEHRDDFKMTGSYWKPYDEMAQLDSEELADFYANSNPSGIFFIFEDDSDDDMYKPPSREILQPSDKDSTNQSPSFNFVCPANIEIQPPIYVTEEPNVVTTQVEKPTKFVSSFKNNFIKATKCIGPKLKRKEHETSKDNSTSSLTVTQSCVDPGVLLTNLISSFDESSVESPENHNTVLRDTRLTANITNINTRQYNAAPVICTAAEHEINAKDASSESHHSHMETDMQSQVMNYSSKDSNILKPEPPVRRSSFDAVEAYSPATIKRSEKREDQNGRRIVDLPHVVPPPPSVPPRTSTLNFYPVRSRPISIGNKVNRSDFIVDIHSDGKRIDFPSNQSDADGGHKATSIRQLKRKQLERKMELEEEERNEARGCSFCIRRCRTVHDARHGRYLQRRPSPHPRALTLPQRRSWPPRVSFRMFYCPRWSLPCYLPSNAIPNLRLECDNHAFYIFDPFEIDCSLNSVSLSDKNISESQVSNSSFYNSSEVSTDSDHLWTPCPQPDSNYTNVCARIRSTSSSSPHLSVSANRSFSSINECVKQDISSNDIFEIGYQEVSKDTRAVLSSELFPADEHHKPVLPLSISEPVIGFVPEASRQCYSCPQLIFCPTQTTSLVSDNSLQESCISSSEPLDDHFSIPKKSSLNLDSPNCFVMAYSASESDINSEGSN